MNSTPIQPNDYLDEGAYVGDIMDFIDETEYNKMLSVIEKVKELLIYDELTLSQIAYLLNYSSVAYLSNQFKRETGFTTSFFKQLKSSKRTGIDRL